MVNLKERILKWPYLNPKQRSRTAIISILVKNNSEIIFKMKIYYYICGEALMTDSHYCILYTSMIIVYHQIFNEIL